MRSHLRTRRKASGGGEDGYVLLTLILMVSLLIIAAAAIVPTISFEIKRDREEEMIHRGVQYSRAIRTYYKKFGRYPARLEDLENTNNLRFLRKRYKDPITGQDFKILRFGDVKLTFSAPLAGAANLNGPSPINGGNTVFGQPQPGGNFGGPVGSIGGPAGFGAAARPATSPDASATTDQNQTTDPSLASSSSSAESSASTTQQQGPQPGGSSSNALSGSTFGGLPVVGVVSTSKKEGIREFNHKKKYSEWQFIYDPATDRGGLLMTPNQPPLQGFANQQLQPGQQGNTTISPFGTQPGLGNNPTSVGPGSGITPSPQPPSNPPQQQ